MATGLVSSLARPGGNLTGLTTMVPDLEGKRLEILREILPKLVTVIVLGNTSNPLTAIQWEQTEISAKALGIQLQLIELQRPEGFKDAFARVARHRPDAITMVADRFLLAHRTQIVDFVAKTRLPAMYPYRDFVIAGGLMSYGPSTRTSSGALRLTSTRFSEASSRASYQSSSRPSSSSWST